MMLLRAGTSFGRGEVTAVKGNSVEVRFASDTKLLAQAR